MESELNSFLAGKNYTRLYNFNAFDIYDLNITERHIICVLISYCKQNPYNTITRSINSLISTCGNVYGRSTIFRVITKLKNIGLIFSEGNGIDSNVYSINVKKLKELQEYSPEQVSAAKKEYLRISGIKIDNSPSDKGFLPVAQYVSVRNFMPAPPDTTEMRMFKDYYGYWRGKSLRAERGAQAIKDAPSWAKDIAAN